MPLSEGITDMLFAVFRPSEGSGLVKDGSQHCVICLGDFLSGNMVRRLACLHLFHTSCVDNWLLNNRWIAHRGIFTHLPISCSLAVMHYSLLPKTYSIALKCILCVFLLDPLLKYSRRECNLIYILPRNVFILDHRYLKLNILFRISLWWRAIALNHRNTLDLCQKQFLVPSKSSKSHNVCLSLSSKFFQALDLHHTGSDLQA